MQQQLSIFDLIDQLLIISIVVTAGLFEVHGQVVLRSLQRIVSLQIFVTFDDNGVKIRYLPDLIDTHLTIPAEYSLKRFGMLIHICITHHIENVLVLRQAAKHLNGMLCFRSSDLCYFDSLHHFTCFLR